MSKAAERSRRIRIEKCPLALAEKRSLVTLVRAVSVEWRGRKPDWRGSRRELSERCEVRREQTSLSRSLEAKGRREMGR